MAGSTGPGKRMVVIGGTGHIGTYLVPTLVKAGHDVAVISRGSCRAYRDDPVWRDVDMVVCDVAGLHQACLDQPDAAAAGQSFNSVGTQAFTLRGHADVVARHLGHEPRLEFVPWDRHRPGIHRRLGVANRN